MRPKLYCFASPVFSDMASGVKSSAEPDFRVHILHGVNREQIQYEEKALAICQALDIESRSGGPAMIYTDADCYFFRPCADDVLTRMGQHDAIFQGDGKGGLATGFFAMRTTLKMRQFWYSVATTHRFYDMTSNAWPGFDEAAVNEWKGEIDWALLPEDEYWTPCYPRHNTAEHGWDMPAGMLPPKVRMVHLSCVYPNDKRRVMAQAQSQFKL